MMDMNSVGALLRFAHLSSNMVLTKALKAFQLSTEQWIILNIVKKESRSQKELALMLNSEQSSITRMVDTLEKNSYVQRITHPTDRRSKLVEITTYAKEKLIEIDKTTTELSAQFDKNFTPQELENLKEYLKRITTSNELYLQEYLND